MWTSVKAAIVVTVCMIGCATAPKTPSGRADLDRNAQDTLATMTRRDPGLQSVLNQSAGYVVFPSVGQGGFIVGGAYGQGVLYQGGQRVGYVKIEQASVGAQAGGQSIAELIVIRDPAVLQQFKTGKFSLGADASVVALTTGAASSANFSGGLAVFVMSKAGAMVNVSVAGQRFKFTPAG